MRVLYKIKKFIINFFGNISLYPNPMFIMFYGGIHYKIKGSHQRHILDMIEPGDILLRTYDHYLSSFFIPGYFSHAAIYVGNGNVIHVLGDGIVNEDILTFMRCDDIAILRIDDKDRIIKAIDKAFELHTLNIKYDYDFNKNDSKTMYCTEFTDVCFGGINYAKQNKIINPDDLLHSEFKVVWQGRKSDI